MAGLGLRPFELTGGPGPSWAPAEGAGPAGWLSEAAAPGRVFFPPKPASKLAGLALNPHSCLCSSVTCTSVQVPPWDADPPWPLTVTSPCWGLGAACGFGESFPAGCPHYVPSSLRVHMGHRRPLGFSCRQRPHSAATEPGLRAPQTPAPGRHPGCEL